MYILSSSRGARLPCARLKPTMAVSNTSVRKHTVSKLGCRLIQRIGGSSSKSEPYNKKAAMPNSKQMAGFSQAYTQGPTNIKTMNESYHVYYPFNQQYFT